MYTLCAEKCEDKVSEFLRLYASKQSHSEQYQMFHKETTVELILNIQKTLLKQDVMQKIGKRRNMRADEIEQMDAVFIKKWYEEKKTVKEKIELYLTEQEEFHLYGFYRFRLQEEKKRIEDVMRKEMENIQMVKDETVEGLQELLWEQKSMEKQIEIRVENEKIQMIGKRGIYLEESLQNYSVDTEDDIIAKLVVISPQFVRVYDKEERISKQTVVLLTRLFGGNIRFEGE